MRADQRDTEHPKGWASGWVLQAPGLWPAETPPPTGQPPCSWQQQLPIGFSSADFTRVDFLSLLFGWSV